MILRLKDGRTVAGSPVEILDWLRALPGAHDQTTRRGYAAFLCRRAGLQLPRADNDELLAERLLPN